MQIDRSKFKNIPARSNPENVVDEMQFLEASEVYEVPALDENETNQWHA